ncbi:MAG: phosphate/phosphite/phosphonate ABC transporter substrate-binding protein [Methylomonas sp.]
MSQFFRLFIILCGFLIQINDIKAEKIYSFAVVPQQSASQLAETWSPVLGWLSQHAGVQLRFVTTPDIPSFEKALSAAEYDFAYMNPYHFTVFNNKPGYHALARAKDERLKGIVVVAKNSPITRIEQLSGTSISLPSPASFAASLLVQAELQRHQINIKPEFVKSHNSVYRNVALGLYPAGGGVPRTLMMMDETVRNELRVLWETASFTSHAIAYQPNIEPEVIKQIQQAMAAMSKDPVGLELLTKIGFKGFEFAHDSDWDDVRQLHIKPEDTQIITEQ